jgi:hypothetical protein
MPHHQIGGAAVSRVRQKMSITFGAKPTVPALLSLIRAPRTVKTKIILYQPDENDGTQFNKSKVCIRLAQMALSSLESEKQTKEVDCPCIEWHSMRHRFERRFHVFGFPRPTLFRQLHIPDADINVYLFTYR